MGAQISSNKIAIDGAPNLGTQTIPGPAGDIPPPPIPDILLDSNTIEKSPDGPVDSVSPVSFEQLHQRSKEVFPMYFEGARFTLQKPISQHFQTSHSFTFNNKDPGYRFGATFVGAKKFSDEDVSPVILAQLTPSGHLQAQIIHQITPVWRLRYVTQVSPEKQHQEISQEWKFGRWLTSLTLVNPSVDMSRFIALTGASAQLNDRLCIVNQFLLQRSPMVPGGTAGSWSIGMRLTSASSVSLPEGPSSAGANEHRTKEQKKWQFAIGASPLSASLQASLAIRVSDQLQLASDFEIQPQQGEAVASVGYQYDLPSANSTFKAQVNSNLQVEASVERRLLPLPFLFTISTRVDPLRNKFGFGLGLSSE